MQTLCLHFQLSSSTAVHLEVVESMDTNVFIQAFQRFCNRRGTKPKVMYCDNGGNFLMANKEINEGIRLLLWMCCRIRVTWCAG